MRYDVAVVGAGPAGSMAAKYAAKYGASTILLEEHPSIGSPVQCTGLLSTRAIYECELSPSPEFSLKEITGAFAYSPSGIEVPVIGGEVKAYVVNRSIFDRAAAEQAIDMGVEVMVRASCRTIAGNVLKVLHEGHPIEIQAGAVILAEGVGGRLSRSLGIKAPARVLSGAQVEAVYESAREDFVEVFAGSWAPGLFAWAVPTGDNLARVGLCARDNAWPRLQKLIKEHPIVSRRYRIQAGDLVVGGVPLGPPPCTLAPGVLVVGDAAAQVKPTSGGGVYLGALCAKIAGRIAAEAVLENNLDRLDEYEKCWRSEIESEISLGMRANRALESLDDQELDNVFETLKDPRIQRLITEHGDMDHPSRLMLKLMFSPAAPKLMPLLGKILRAGLS